MLVISTVGPDNATTVAEPFVVGKAEQERDGALSVFLMQEAVYLASERHADLSELTSPGFAPLSELVADLRDDGVLDEAVVCEPCATARHVEADDLREWATLGGPADLARLTERHDTTLTF